MDKVDIKQEVEPGICPYCNEKYETKWYKSHKKCSECGMPFNLCEQKEKKENEVEKHNKQIKKDNGIQKENEKTTIKSRYTKVGENNGAQSNNLSQESISESSSPGTTVANTNQNNFSNEMYENDIDNSYQEEYNVSQAAGEGKNIKKSLFEDDEYEDVEIYDEYEAEKNEDTGKEEDTQSISEIITENKGEEFTIKNILKKEKSVLIKKTKSNEELEVEESVFNSNEDGFYNDATPTVNPQEDHIKKSTILKIVGMSVSLILITIFMIYYA